MKRKRPPIHQIELRIGSLPELFNSMDPTPFHRRDLDAAAEEFIESWALEYPQNSRFRIMVHIEQATSEDSSRLVGTAIHNYFNYKAELLKRNVKVLLLEGRTSLMIGLVFLAACLLGAVRVTDVVARIGGEEFVVLLPQTRLDAAVQLAEKLLRTLQQSPAQVARGVSIGFTASLGVGSLPAGHSSTVAALYAAADHALYEAKRLGRNRVEKTEPDGNLTPSDFQRMRRQ